MMEAIKIAPLWDTLGALRQRGIGRQRGIRPPLGHWGIGKQRGIGPPWGIGALRGIAVPKIWWRPIKKHRWGIRKHWARLGH